MAGVNWNPVRFHHCGGRFIEIDRVRLLELLRQSRGLDDYFSLDATWTLCRSLILATGHFSNCIGHRLHLQFSRVEMTWSVFTRDTRSDQNEWVIQLSVHFESTYFKSQLQRAPVAVLQLFLLGGMANFEIVMPTPPPPFPLLYNYIILYYYYILLWILIIDATTNSIIRLYSICYHILLHTIMNIDYWY